MGHARTLVDRYWAMVESGDWDGLRQIHAPDTELILPGPGGTRQRFTGVEPVIEVLKAYRVAFPDFFHNIQTTTEDGDRIVIEMKVGGTHTGPFATPGGELPPTGRRLDIGAVDVVTLAYGKVQSWHTYFDQVEYLTQLGLMPSLQEVG